MLIRLERNREKILGFENVTNNHASKFENMQNGNQKPEITPRSSFTPSLPTANKKLKYKQVIHSRALVNLVNLTNIQSEV